MDNAHPTITQDFKLTQSFLLWWALPRISQMSHSFYGQCPPYDYYTPFLVNKEAFANRVFPRSYPQSKTDMIELVSESRCIECNLCVNVCPTNVFDKVPDAPPIIARQSDCQTCFMCELYCPVDALYVAPQVEPLESVDEKSLKETGLLGSYRNNIGWGRDRTNTAKQDSTHLILKQLK